MNIDELTLGQIKEIQAMPQAAPSAAVVTGFEIGQHYLIRTVTMIQTGRVVSINDHEVLIDDAAWIADTGEFSAALLSLDFCEVEPFPDGVVIVGRGAIVDAAKIRPFDRSKK